MNRPRVACWAHERTTQGLARNRSAALHGLRLVRGRVPTACALASAPKRRAWRCQANCAARCSRLHGLCPVRRTLPLRCDPHGAQCARAGTRTRGQLAYSDALHCCDHDVPRHPPAFDPRLHGRRRCCGLRTNDYHHYHRGYLACAGWPNRRPPGVIPPTNEPSLTAGFFAFCLFEE
jgi:hypothetical protein